jgi:diguanylate cyclase (GGDEF)-like protein/PAS domain S-box-containing protein
MTVSSEEKSKAFAPARLGLLAMLGVALFAGSASFLLASALGKGFAFLLMAAGVLFVAAALLSRSEDGRQMRAMLEHCLDAAAIVQRSRDGGFHVIFANEKAARLCGPLSVGEVLQLTAVRAGLTAAACGKASQDEIALTPDDASPAWLHCQFLPMPRGVALLMRDISASKAEDLENRQVRQNHAFLQSLIENLPLLIFAKSFRAEHYDKMVVWNKTAEHIMGYGVDEVLGKSNSEIFPAKVADTLNALDRQMLAAPKVVTIPEFPYRRPDGALAYLRSTSIPMFGEDGKVDYILGVVDDITARRAQELDLRAQRAEMAAINDASPVGLFRTDAGGKIVYVNATFLRMLHAEREDIMRAGWSGAIHPDDRDVVVREWEHAMQRELPYENTLRFVAGEGRVLWGALKAAPVRMDGKLHGYVGSMDDITVRLQAEQELLKGERWLRTIADNLPALIAYVDREQRYRFTNVNYEHWFQRDGAQVLGSHVSEVFGAEYYTFTSSKIAAVLRGERVNFERDGTDRAGHKRCWRIEYIPDVQDGKVVGFYSMVLDITEAKELENRLRTMARTDSLTGLPNRVAFNENLNGAIANCDANGVALAVLFLDVDYFKRINDDFGHHTGDAVLREFSRRLTASVRQTDSVARLAGDEFVILLAGKDAASESETVARKIQAEMQRDFEVVSGSCKVTTSIGIAIRRDGEAEPESLLRRADEALYKAKSQGRNTYVSIL